MHQSAQHRRLVLAASFLLLAPARRAFAHRDDYINETFVFQTLQARELEPELWLESGREASEDGSFRAIAGAFEYGITDHWMVDGFARWLDPDESSGSFQRFRAETRVRFGEEGDKPVDLAASIEVEYEKEEEGAKGTGASARAWALTPRLVLSRDLASSFNVTMNLDLSRQLGSELRDRWVPGYALAMRYPREGFLRYGTELQQDFGQERSTLFVPQIWLSLPHEATLKLGTGIGSRRGDRQEFLRLVFEVEF